MLQFQSIFFATTILSRVCYLFLIEKLNNEHNSFRKACEAHIVQKAKTLEPRGINKRDGQ